MTNENTRNRPRYPIEQALASERPAPDGITPVPLTQNGMNELPGEVCVTPDNDVDTAAEPVRERFQIKSAKQRNY